MKIYSTQKSNEIYHKDSGNFKMNEARVSDFLISFNLYSYVKIDFINILKIIL